MTSTELAAALAADVAAGRWAEGQRLPGVRAIARTAGCSPGTAARAYSALRDAGVIGGSPRSRFVVAAGGPLRAGAWGAAAGPSLRVAGSDDPALDLLLRACGDSASLTAGPRGSVHGLAQLARGTADAAAVHLLDAASGRWNDPLARGALAGEPVVLVHLWRREQGLVLPPGNPLRIRGPADLDGRRIAWRAPGTGSRLLLERLMLSAGCEPHPELGEPADSHMAVAAAVGAGAVDAGLAVRSVAESAGLDWLPVASEPFELALSEESRAALEPLLTVLAGGAFQQRIAALPGYDLTLSGEDRAAA